MNVTPGVTATVEWTVQEQHCTHRGEHDIFSTPNLVHLLEDAAIEALAPFLDEGQGSVGSKVHVTHTAPTLKGQKVRATATVAEVDRRRVSFTVVVEDDIETIGEGTHERFVIDLAKFDARLNSKGAS
ncbi:thioesterase family protein [Streptosporangium sp. KLBMP 9127]|nr:thioesterase family protein [Streptosporangium sp. KLBMP 9127]